MQVYRRHSTNTAFFWKIPECHYSLSTHNSAVHFLSTFLIFNFYLHKCTQPLQWIPIKVMIYLGRQDLLRIIVQIFWTFLQTLFTYAHFSRWNLYFMKKNKGKVSFKPPSLWDNILVFLKSIQLQGSGMEM